MKMEYKNLVFKKEEDFYLIKINRPKKLNALNQETLSELKKCFEYIGNNTKGFYGVIITGEGEKSFVAGADIKEFIGLDDKMSKSFCENGHNVFNSIENLSIPVIGLVNGYALGGGCELSLSCHIRIATKNAKFSQPEVNLGIIPGYGGTQRLTQVIGKSRAIEMMLTAEMIDAEKAFDFGLVNHIAEDYDKAYDKAKNIIATVKRKGPDAIKNVIRSVNTFYDNSKNGFKEEIKSFVDCTETEDFKEGVKAFLEKRCPSFKGK